jgi:hypothetical protein
MLFHYLNCIQIILGIIFIINNNNNNYQVISFQFDLNFYQNILTTNNEFNCTGYNLTECVLCGLGTYYEEGNSILTFKVLLI